MALQVQARGTTVVDVTHACNARCRYCQWGDPSNPNPAGADLKESLIPDETLRILGTRRIVVSGGEPTLHPHIRDILRYYSERVEQVVVITNGYALNKKTASSLLDSGATGITVSLDSVHPIESFMTRRTPPALHKRIMINLREMSGQGRKFELGINATVSSVTASPVSVADLLGFGLELGADFVKFQPVFDDGYVSKNSPELLLGPDSAGPLLEIASLVPSMAGPPTNPAEFWSDVAELAGGGRLSPSGCAIGSRDALLSGGRMRICYWVEPSEYARAGARPYHDAVSEFNRAKRRCDVGFHCFCNQGLSHAWKSR